jgi:hypothetical protein
VESLEQCDPLHICSARGQEQLKQHDGASKNINLVRAITAVVQSPATCGEQDLWSGIARRATDKSACTTPKHARGKRIKLAKELILTS